MNIIKRLTALNLNTPVAIVGAGATGKSCFDILNLAKIECHVFDEINDIIPKNFSNYPQKISLGKFDNKTFANYQTILLSPGIDKRRQCFTKYQDKLLTDIELFCQLTKKPIIGVTGSNGKSTVVSLLYQATKKANKNYILCGNIGLPVLQALLEEQPYCDGYIVELSSYHLEISSLLHLEIGAWLNVTPDHLDRYDSYENYVTTKAKIFNCAKHIVANADDDKVKFYGQKHLASTWFSQLDDSADYYLDGDNIVRNNDNVVFNMQQFSPVGMHYADDVMAVFAIAELLGITAIDIAAACAEFKPLACRSQIIGEKNGITFINDSKATNVGATVAAINSLQRPIILIAGGQDKDQDFSKLANIGSNKLKAIFLIGRAAPMLYKIFNKIVHCNISDNLEQAFNRAVVAADTGDVIMLSPACASFDMFKNYLARGKEFERLVRNYLHE